MKNYTKRIFTLLLLMFVTILYGISQKNILDKLKVDLSYPEKGTLLEAGINRDSIQVLTDIIETLEEKDLRGIVVIKDDKLVFEEYFNTYWRSTIHDVRSAAKSVTALLVGIAIDEGLIQDVDQSVASFFSDEHNFSSSDHFSKITLKHLLNMSSGLDADTYDINSKGHEVNWLSAEDWVSYSLNLPLDFEPGSKWVYTDVCAMLLGAIIEKVSAMTLVEYASKHLFSPLGISEYYWYKSPEKVTSGMGNLYLSTLDFAKIGIVVLNNGSYQGKRIISKTWIDRIKESVFVISENNPFADEYGYMWYKSERSFGNSKVEYLFASGMGGNVLTIIPEKNMVVSITSSAYGQDYGHFRSYNIFKFIMTALE